MALAALALAREGAAQTTLYLRTLAEDLPCADPSCQAQLLTAAVDPPVVRSVVDIDDRAPATYVFPDGSLTAGLRDSSTDRAAIVVRNTATGATAVVPAPRASTLIGNPVRPEVYFNDEQGPLAATFSGLRRLTPPACATASASQAISVSADGRRVAYFHQCSAVFSGVIVIDTNSGATVGTLPGLVGGSLSDDGTTLYSAYLTYLRRYNATTGAVLAEVDFSPQTPSMPVVDPNSGAVLVGLDDLGFGGSVYDANLQFMQGSTAFRNGSWWFDPNRPRAFALTTHRFNQTLVLEGVRIVDTATWTTMLDVQLGPGPRASMVAAFVPAVTGTLTAHVAGSAVSLSWTEGGPAATVSRFVLEVGSAPGLSDIFAGLDVGLRTSFSAAGVPPGTYYVRVRAGNYSGLSAPSNEVVVTVP
ncbi:MAG: fibronectin type III domain-containing protein [Vicinamibacterales bacterium]